MKKGSGKSIERKGNRKNQSHGVRTGEEKKKQRKGKKGKFVRKKKE